MAETEERGGAYQRLADATAHDVRNALNAMAIHLAVLSDRLGGVDGTPARSVAALQAQVGRIEAILRRFQRLASPPPEEGEVDLGELVLQALEACAHDARRHGVTVQADLCPVLVRGRLPGLTEAVLVGVLGAIEEGRGGQLKVGLAVQGPEAVLSLVAQAGAGAGPSAPRELRLPLAG